MKHALKKFSRYSKEHGLAKALGMSMRVLASSTPEAPASVFHRTDIIGSFVDLLGREHGTSKQLSDINPDEDTIQWVVPNFGFGSGGHLNIFRFINLLAERGFKQRLIILTPHGWSSAEAAKAQLEEWYFPLQAEVYLGVNDFAPSHITVATGWQTAYVVAKHLASRHKFYFVQDFEPSFYPVSAEYFLAEDTYKLGLKGITAGSWLKDKLTAEYGMQCDDFSFSYDKEFYVRSPKRDHGNFNIMFYSRHATQRRLFELGLCALDIVCKRHPNAAVIFAGGDVSKFHIPFHHLNAGELSLSELPDLYSQSDLGLVLSGTNLSLLPLELAACGCPVVMNDSPSAKWLLNDDAAFYSPPNPEKMADVICKAIEDEQRRNKVAERALTIARESSWEAEADKVAAIFRDAK